MEEEKLQAAKAILLDNDGNKFAAIKAFMAQYGTDIDTAASYINQAYIMLDVPNATVAYCEPNPQPMLPAPPIQEDTEVKEYVVETKPTPTSGQIAAKIIDGIVFLLFSCAVNFLRLCIKVFTFMFLFFVHCFLAIVLIFFTDKYTKKKRSYWDRW
jgi:hypothetical protein